MTGSLGPAGFAGEWHGGRVTDFATCVLAPNAGPMTLDGTNTWLLGAPATRGVAIVDPGPADEAHWTAVEAALDAADKRPETILLTHGHRDHSAGAFLFAERTGCNVRALDPRHRLGDEGLIGGDSIDVDGAVIDVVSTPGHSSDSLSFVLRDDRSLLTGDTVLGRGTTVVAHPDGQLGPYLDSLNRLAEVVGDYGLTSILPGHGPALSQPAAVIDAYLAHRRERLAAVEQVWRELGADSVVNDDTIAQEIVARVYADVPRSVWPAALLSVRAQLEFLSSRDA